MGPDRKDKRKAPGETQRMSQEVDELLATSKRLLGETQALMQRARQLIKEHAAAASKAKR